MTMSVVPPQSAGEHGGEDDIDAAVKPSASSTSTDARRFAWACVLGGTLSMIVLTWFVTRGFATLFDRPRLGGFFDAQARAMFHGHWDVPAGAAAFERFKIDGRYYMYFGPTPALLRMPLLVLSSWFDGRLSRVSMIVASAGVVFGIARLSWLARRTVRADRPVSRGEQVVAASVVVVGSLGTVVPFVAGWTAVYHEAIQWGLAFALISYGALVAWMLDRRARDLVVAGAAAALSILARGSVGLGPVAAIGLVALVKGITALRAARAAGRLDWRPLVALGAAVLVPLVLYGYVNAAKFGSPLAPPPYAKQDLLVDYPPRMGALDANGGNLFGFGYAPTAVVQYLRPDGVAFDRLFPFVLTSDSVDVIGNAVFDNVRPTASTTTSAPLALLFALGGIVVVVLRRSLRRWWLPVAAGAAIGCVGALSVAFVDQRYQADFVPLLVVPGVVGAWALVDWLPTRSRAVGATVVGLVALLGAWSIWANTATAFVYQRSQVLSASVADRASLVKAQLEVQDLLGGGLPSRVGAGDTLPAHGTDGSLFVLGHCDGVYRHDGVVWQPVELTAATGHSRLQARLDPGAHGRQPLLSSVDDRGTTVIWALPRADGRVGLEYQWEPRSPGAEPARVIPLGVATRQADGSLDLSVDVGGDVFTTRLQVSAGGHVLHDGPINDLHGPLVLGRQSGLPGATSFAGQVRALPVPTPLCDRLVDMGLELPRS